MANSTDTLNSIIPSSVDELVNKSIAEMSYTLSKYYGTSLQFLSPNNINYLIVVALCARVFDMYSALKYSIRNLLMPYATGEFLDLYGFNKGLTRVASGAASGRVFIQANSTGLTLPIGTKLEGNNDLSYTVTSSTASTQYQLAITSIVIYNGKATLQLTLPSGWGDCAMYTGQTVAVSGVSDSIFNGQKTVTVNNANTIQYDVPFGTSVPSSTSGAVVTFTGSVFTVQCDDPSSLSNLKSSSILTLKEIVSGYESIAYVTFSGLSGGTDGESDDSYRDRVLARYQNPMVSLGEADVKFRLTSYDPALTLIKVNRATPSDGKTAILCGYQGKTASERVVSLTRLTEYRDKILDRSYIGVVPTDLIFSNFTYVPINVNVQDVIPNDENLKNTIRQNIERVFESRSYGLDVKTQEIRAAIESSVSLHGVEVTSYNLTSPSSLVSIGDDEIASLGTVTVVG